MDFVEAAEKLRGLNKKIVFPEGDDIRIILAAIRLNKEKIAKPILLGNEKIIHYMCESNDLDLEDIPIIDNLENNRYMDYVDKMVEVRHGKNTREDCANMLRGRNYYGMMMLYNGEVDALLGGATYSTADTIRPALQIIKTKPTSKIASSCFLFIKEGAEPLLYADCGVNVNPTSEELVNIAKDSVINARNFGIDPKVAFLSYSTKGSAKSESVSKVLEAVSLLRDENPDFPFDGELQFDAAFVEKVAKQKAKGSPVAGKANVFIFPNLDAGNIAYKITERLGGYQALGPILQGLKKPVNDLSRGCNEDDVYKMAIITLLQE